MKDDKKIKKTNKDDKNIENQIAELSDQLKRAVADYQNLQRRVVEERINSVKYANGELLKKILPSFDNLYLAEKYIEDAGIKLTVEKLTESLEEVGVKRIDVNNKKFDPNFMECIEVVDGESDVVIEEIRPGYMLFDKIIRPAQVKVGNK